MGPRKYNAYFPDNTTAIIVPRDKDKATVTRASAEAAEANKPAPTEKVERTVAEEMKVLAPYQPNEKELALVAWAKKNLEPVTASEVHGVIYRSVKGFYVTSPKDEIAVRKKAADLGVGLPEYRK